MTAPHLSPGTRLDNTVYLSGQLPFGADGTLPEGIAAQTRQVLSNLAAVLHNFDLGLEAIVKTGVFITRVEDFAGFAAVYAEVFGTHKPARSTVIAGLVAPGALIEIDAIAQVSDQAS